MTYINLCRSPSEISCSYQLNTSVLSAAIYNAESASTIWMTKFYIPLFFRVSITSVMNVGACISQSQSRKGWCPSRARSMNVGRMWTLCLLRLWPSLRTMLYMRHILQSSPYSRRRRQTGVLKKGRLHQLKTVINHYNQQIVL